MADIQTTMADTTISAVVTVLEGIRWAVPTAVERSLVEGPMAAATARSRVADRMAAATVRSLVVDLTVGAFLDRA